MTVTTNEALRHHVTRVGFDLTMGKTHIAALVYIDVCIRTKSFVDSRSAARAFSWFATGAQGLSERGLVTHCFNERWHNRPGNHLGRHYTITKAGRLVRDLLKEAGIWQEYEATLPVSREVAS